MEKISARGAFIITLVLLGTMLLASIVVAIVLFHQQIQPFLPWVGVIAGLFVVYGLYDRWSMHHARRVTVNAQARMLTEQIRRDNDLQEHKKWVETQDLLHKQQIAQDQLALKQQELTIRQMELTLEHQRLSHAQQHVLLPAGHTVVFPHDDYRTVYSAPRAAIASRAGQQQQEAGQDEDDLPTNVRYEEIRSQVPKGHILVGIGRRGLETKEKAVGACVWIVGLSGTGKTSTTVLRVEERHLDGNKFLGVDPHWFKDDSLTNAVRPYTDQFLMPMARTPEESKAVLQAFIDEFNARKGGQRPKPWQKITLLVDEVGALMDPTTDEEEEIKSMLPSIARICGQEARNFNMGGIFISQQATGLAWLRKMALMVIVHQLLMESEKLLAVNGDKEVVQEMKYWPIGRTYVYGVGFNETGPITVQQPYFSRDQQQTVVSEIHDDSGSRKESPNTFFYAGEPRNTGPLNASSESVLNGPERMVPTTDPTVPVAGPQLGPTDKAFTSEQEREFLIRYRKNPQAIKNILRQMNNGEGLGNAYVKHASWLLEREGLRG